MAHGPHRHADISAHAGLLLATVDRALNRRPGTRRLR